VIGVATSIKQRGAILVASGQCRSCDGSQLLQQGNNGCLFHPIIDLFRNVCGIPAMYLSSQRRRRSTLAEK
jgi:hypothetical protein